MQDDVASAETPKKNKNKKKRAGPFKLEIDWVKSYKVAAPKSPGTLAETADSEPSRTDGADEPGDAAPLGLEGGR